MFVNESQLLLTLRKENKMSDITKVNINTATLEELTSVQGIGPGLAKRIIDKRPFSNLDDLTRVSGIGENSLEKLKPVLTDQETELPADFQSFVDSIRDETKAEPIINEAAFEDDQALSIEEDHEEVSRLDQVIDAAFVEPEPSGSHDQEKDLEEDMVEAEVEIIEPDPIHGEEVQIGSKISDIEIETPVEASEKVSEVDSGIPSETEKPVETIFKEEVIPHKIDDQTQPEKSSSDEPISRSQLIWSLIGTAIFSILLTILITLGILSATNGGLKYATVSEASRLENQITILNDLTSTMQTDMQGIRTRLDALETVAGRVSVLEGRADSMEADLSTIQTTIKEISETLTTVQDEILALQESAQKSEDFRSGLLELLLNIDGQTQEGK
jgi:competence protein ComEA